MSAFKRLTDIVSSKLLDFELRGIAHLYKADFLYYKGTLAPSSYTTKKRGGCFALSGYITKNRLEMLDIV